MQKKKQFHFFLQFSVCQVVLFFFENIRPVHVKKKIQWFKKINDWFEENKT